MSLKVKRASSGLVIFTDMPIRMGDFVIEYTGERISSEEADRRGGAYLFTVNDDLVLDARGREHIARYMNHSCRPNCFAEVDEDEERIFIYAKRHIRAGEELTYNYGKEYFEDRIQPHGCRCEKCSPHL